VSQAHTLAARKPDEDDRRTRVELEQLGPKRRLSDRILAAFTIACSAGETEIAAELRTMLARVEGAAPLGQRERRRASAMEQAELWAAYVAAREAYKALLAAEAPEAAEATAAPQAQALAAALERMKACYRDWSAA